MATTHVTFRAPSLVGAGGAAARSIARLHGVSSVTVDATSGAVAVRFDPSRVSARALRERVRGPARPPAPIVAILVHAARWVPLVARAVLAVA